ncbi:MAG: hypothetical protein CMJ29_10075 [Phycisphaerae bacterium]|nr:hypothetical protein [Phycisphaerae bacterium]
MALLLRADCAAFEIRSLQSQRERETADHPESILYRLDAQRNHRPRTDLAVREPYNYFRSIVTDRAHFFTQKWM